jgi:Ser-tRNA(Ala) deacylase AlaX
MTQKLFWQDPYLTSLNTHITRVDGNDVVSADLYVF